MTVAERLVLIGTKGGPAVRPGGAMPTSSLLQLGGRRIVVDCGLAVTAGIARAGVSLLDVDLIFITHLHSDHILELGPLLHTAWTTGRSQPITVFGPPGTDAYWAAFLDSMAFDARIRVEDEGRVPLVDLVDLRIYGEGEVVGGDFTVRALRVNHPPVTDCFALRFDAGRSVTFSADTSYFPPLADFAQGSDVLVHEAMLPDAIEALVTRTNGGDALRRHLHASHTNASDAGRIALAAGVRHLVLHHLIPADDPAYGPTDWMAAVRAHWTGPLSIGRDGLVIELGGNTDAAAEKLDRKRE